MTDTSKGKPDPADEKFKPQNVTEPQHGGDHQTRHPADTKGINVAKGSHGDNLRRSTGDR
ncbi:hypothetical protein EYB45_08080 [Erythrobacteraceae bacterium CFH 75059]|uniref:hypothetical protein n=1 Tax=Qipengyuania thermophila TaxID=2509361 RepID=UPI00102103C5|nr:hypothetical protein [Qipengyuania thermophila]TCD05421.1 hypothetical protein EYB45_08080 [Erythrobacteraceae bacterium CFH 75059]